MADKPLLCQGFLPEEQSEFEPPKKLLVSQWADQHRVLDPATSAEPGPWRTYRTPYLKYIMDTFCNTEIEQVVFQSCTQVGKTETILNILGYIIDQSPGPTMLVFPTVESAEDVSRTRIQPMIDSHEGLRRRKRGDRHLFTTMRMQFFGMDLFLSGANSAASLSSKPIQYLLFDEVNIYPSILGEEGDTIGIALERTKTFVHSRKIFMVSTPTTKSGRITEALNSCDAIYDYFLPCPHCGNHQVLKFSQVKWPEGKKNDFARYRNAARQTSYECECCHHTITDYDKPKMMQAGRWKPSSPAETVHKVGFRLSSLYSPWIGFGAMAEKFLEAKAYPEKLQVFVNKWLGEPWEERATRMKSDEIFKLADDRPRGLVPSEALILTAGVDVQQYHFSYVIRGWARDLTSWLIREGVVETFQDLEAVLFGSSYDIVGSNKKRLVSLACIDSGYRTDEVYEWSRMHHGRVRAIKGASHKMNAPFTPTRIDYVPHGKLIYGGLTLWILDTDYWKDALFRRMQINPEDPGAWRVHGEITREYAEQMVAEEKAIIRSKKSGHTREEWQKITEHTANHFWDCECYALAAAEMVGVRYVQNYQPKEPSREPSEQRQRSWIDSEKSKNWLRPIR